ncbi:insulinase family protein [Oceanirhabdus sp. W0125-5]|uniref:insulinase family protein n=1 Tax=Oceanirhabdus sp. W0125-5 TaxID=2999116 RepID=UPI0022F2DCE4|nr:insulinase family protein [Oceanirhabdus sp. W0125-5]WBW97692.1 insulinase family protein [Oceanirhabdus sp. W0125-5]
MTFKINETYNGFKLLREEKVEEANSISRLFEHEKTGARLLSLFNDDDNKVFSISFRTPPEDHTGLPHILEHSVLCGSRKFPTKEPFVELMKGSLNTFLNAMTFSDKTMYPIASKNDKDFFNIMDVYMDAVFYPNLHEIPEILMQEGWHYHLEKKEDKLTYKGVVYNEMKGAFSSPEGVLHRKIEESVLKDTIYANESGGDPDFITDLTQEQFEEFHRKYYHPSNSYIFLYGNGDLQEQLRFINEEYLNNFDKLEIDSHIEKQQPYEEIRNLEVNYSISPDDDDKEKTYLSLNYVVGESTDRELVLGMDILEYMLLENPAAPLKKALVDANLGKDVFGSYNNSVIQPVLSIILKNSDTDKAEEFKKVVYDTLRDLVEKGIDKDLIEASININEFKLRESEMGGLSKGLLYAIRCMDGWLYEADPLMHLRYENELQSIKEKSKTGYFEDLIKKYILDNKHGSLLILSPKKGMAEERSEEVQRKLDEYKASLSEEEINKIVEGTKKLLQRQMTPDTKEALSTIPLVELEDIPNEPEKIPQVQKEIEGIKALYQEVFTSKIAYLHLLFDASVVEQEDIQYIALLGSILGKVSTEDKHYSKLSNEININTGGIRFSTESYSKDGDDQIFYPKFSVRAKALSDKIPNMISLIKEIILTSKFDEDKRIKELISQLKSRLEMTIFDRGHSVAANRLLSYFSPAGKYHEMISGISLYKFICNLEKNFEEMKEEIKSKLKGCAKNILNKNGLLISVTCEDEEYKIIENNIGDLLAGISDEKISQKEYSFEEVRDNEGLKTPGNVQYVAKGYNYIRLGNQYTGKLQVLKKVTSIDYLWNKVRVQGGAYGCMVRLTRAGSLIFTSYRDPNLKETLDAYDNTFKYLKDIDIDDREMRKYIIGTISEMDSPLSPVLKGEKAVADFIKGLTYDDYKKEREEALATTQEDIKQLSSIYEDVMRKGFYCAMGNESKINKNKELFNKFVNVFE